MKAITILAAALLLSGSAAYQKPVPVPIVEDCAYYAAMSEAETGVPASITLALGLEVEAWGDLKHEPARCRNGTFDHGPGLNSRWLPWFAERFNGGVEIDPTSPESMLIVARILAWNYESFGNWPMAMTAYRRGIEGAKKHGVDIEYVDKVIAAMAKGEPCALKSPTPSARPER